jgi:hypothetical protein
VFAGAQVEVGWFPVELVGRDHWLEGWPDVFEPFHWHGDTFDLPVGATLLASSAAYPHQAFRLGSGLGLQFHVEATAEMVRDWSSAPDLGERPRRAGGIRRGRDGAVGGLARDGLRTGCRTGRPARLERSRSRGKRRLTRSLAGRRRGLVPPATSPALPSVVDLGHVGVVSAAHQAQVLGIVLTPISERVSVVELQPIPGRAAPPLVVDEGTAAAVPLIDRSPDSRGNVSRLRRNARVSKALARSYRRSEAAGLQASQLVADGVTPLSKLVKGTAFNRSRASWSSTRRAARGASSWPLTST